MKKRVLAVILTLMMCLALAIPAIAAEKDEASGHWQGGVFNDGVYEGYYTQLDDVQKILYNKIKEAFAEPTQAANIEFDEPIILKAEDGGSFTADDKYQWMCDNMYNQYGGRYAVYRDHPELPWLLAVDYGARTLGEWIYDDQGVSIGYKMTGIYYENTYPWVPPEVYKDPAALEEAVDKAMSEIGEARPSRAATARAILDYLCDLISYKSRTDTIPDKDGGNAHTVYYDHTAYSAMVPPNQCVCSGYAAAFKLMCDRYRIPCIHVSGMVEGGGHAWNYVQLEDGNWYAVDSTWADGESSVDYTYFLVGKNSKNRFDLPFETTHEVPASNCGLSCPPLVDQAYPYLEAALNEIPEAVNPGESIRLQISEIKNLAGSTINSGTVGLFEGNAPAPVTTGRIRNGRVSLDYNAVESKLDKDGYSLYVKCTDGKYQGAILAGVRLMPMPTLPANPTNDKLSVDGAEAAPAAYKIDGANYFKLRDVAMLVNGTKGQFSVEYDGEKSAIMITAGQPYQPIGGELGTVPSSAAKATTSNDAVYVNGVKADLTAYKIDGANYYGLRELGKQLGFNVGWTQEHGMFIEGDKPYTDAD